jgi:hypothetical protein
MSCPSPVIPIAHLPESSPKVNHRQLQRQLYDLKGYWLDSSRYPGLSTGGSYVQIKLLV